MVTPTSIIALYETIKFPGSSAQDALPRLSLAVVALGVLCWLDEVLGDTMFYASRSVSAVPPHMTLVDEARHMASQSVRDRRRLD